MKNSQNIVQKGAEECFENECCIIYEQKPMSMRVHTSKAKCIKTTNISLKTNAFSVAANQKYYIKLKFHKQLFQSEKEEQKRNFYTFFYKLFQK